LDIAIMSVDPSNAQASAKAAAEQIERGRDCYRRRAWAGAFEALSAVGAAVALCGDDLERLALSAYLVDRDDDYLAALARAYQAHLDAGQWQRAVRCAFWLGLRLLFRGESGRASGWLTRARRLLEPDRGDCVEQGYLLLPLVQAHLDAGDGEKAHATAADAATIGERFGEADLTSLARHLQGRALIQQGQVERGIALLDEVMVAVAAEQLSPLVTGLIYCSVIEGCQQVFALARAREWTAALTHWCDAQSGMVAFTGTCLVHRAEVMQFHGEWQQALEEAQRACERFAHRTNQRAAAAALYQQAQVHRLRGHLEAAQALYRDASHLGWDPQPGLALLRMAQGRIDDAAAAIRRAVDAATDRFQRARLLPAQIEILLRANELTQARTACDELQQIAQGFGPSALAGAAAQARGAVELAQGNAAAALASLRCASGLWHEFDAPYEAARTRVLTAMACRAMGDKDGAEMELAAARSAFERLGAAPDVRHVDQLAGASDSGRRDRLTVRELQVLRLLAKGITNKAIATELFLSEKTVNRHTSNIFDKLDVHSRAAATAYAYEHKLI
jgi:DNA-binding CsgD family transcriptional regulator